MNILFVNYGDLTTNSLNHIGPFAKALSRRGHSCVVAVPAATAGTRMVFDETIPVTTFADHLGGKSRYPDGRGPDLVHAWTPREIVRRFLLSLPQRPRPRVIVHLEDNEDFLFCQHSGLSVDELAMLPEERILPHVREALVHPRRAHQWLRIADGVTCIVESLRTLVPPETPSIVLEPAVDFERYHPQPADAALRTELGLDADEKVIVFTGSSTFANQEETYELYRAIALLNARGRRTRLIRTGLNTDTFAAGIPAEALPHVLDFGFLEKARLPRLLALADALVQPGRPGPFNDFRLPSKLPEFLAMGRPVVLPASNLGGQLRDQLDALVLPIADAPAIADACERIFDDPALAQRLSENAASFARAHFDPSEQVAKLSSFYEYILTRPPRPASAATHAGSEITLALADLADRFRSLPGHEAAGQQLAELAALIESLETGSAEQAARAELETERDRWRTACKLAQAHVEHIEQRLRLTETHAGNLERALQQVQRRLDLEAAQFRETLQQRELLLIQREAKLRTIQSSVSWRITVPLRALRRRLVDPWLRRRAQARASGREGLDPGERSGRPTSDQTIPIWFSVDHPRAWLLPPGPVTLRGWCFADDGRALQGVRALIGQQVVEGTYGLKRLDVAASVRGRPAAEYSGWRIDAELQAGEWDLVLEARDETGAWLRFFKIMLRVAEDFAPLDLSSYEKWIEANDHPSAAELQAQTRDAESWADRPRISILLPVFNPPERWLQRAIESVLAQTYPEWELCIADDASDAAHVRPLLERFAASDARIRVHFRATNGHIAAASNSALELARGDWIGLLDHDDELSPEALYHVARAIRLNPEAAYFYSDEDKMDEQGRRFDPYFKPDWNPDLFRGQNYTSHFSVLRASLVRSVGGFREGFEGSQDWDLFLRVIERCRPEQIRHIPKILYHWRAIPGSTALVLAEKDYPVEAARRALNEHFARQGQVVKLLPVPGDHWRVKYPLPEKPPLVSLIIPTRNQLALLRRCVDSVLQRTDYPRFEILIVDNQSDDPETMAWLRRLQEPRVRVIAYPHPFNYSALNNFGVEHAGGDVIGLLNNDLEVINREWLEEMVSQALRPGVGCVGAMLYYPNDTIQHAGVILGLGGVAGHAFRDFPRGTEGRFNRARLVQNYSAVTAACLLVRKSIYQEVGGLDERELAVAFNDVDFCLKVRAAGYWNVWTPFAELYHHESVSRGADDTDEKRARFKREVETMLHRWSGHLENDPAYNPNLTLEANDFSVAPAPRVSLPSPNLGPLRAAAAGAVMSDPAIA